jgi:uncharacterized repeat protein (TIGR01451 family)
MFQFKQRRKTFVFRVAICTLLLSIFATLTDMAGFGVIQKAWAQTTGYGPVVSEPVVPQVLDIDLQTLPKLDLQQAAQSLQVAPIGELLAPDLYANFPVAPENREALLGSLQSTIGASTTPSAFTAPSPNFDGIGFTGSVPPDPIGDVGRNHYIQAVNVSFQIFDKQGNSLAGPSAINTLWTTLNFPGACSTQNNGDPVVVYDHLADRWLISQFAIPNGFATPPTHQCVAISRTADPVNGGWYLYDFTFNFAHDYPKIGVWPDGYYMSSQQGYPGGGLNLVVFDRANMLNGNPATFQTFTVGSPALVLLPSDLDGPAPPVGTPNFFARQVDGGLWGGADRVEIYEFHVDWGNPASSSLTGPISLPTAPFDSGLCNPGDLGENCILQPNAGSAQLAAITVWPMWRLQYRNFGGHETLVFNHTVDADGNTHAGIRWYELRKAGGGTWSIFQQGTFAPQDANRRPGWEHRWMGSISMDKTGNIALGYSVASTNTLAVADIDGFPSIRYAGRMANDPLGLLPHGEFTLVNGTGVQALFNAAGDLISRWGDYSSMNVDPVDDCTFWYTQEYALASGAWQTRIGAFKFPSCTPSDLAVSLMAQPISAIAGDKLTLSISVVNHGPSPATNVVLTNTLPVGVIYEANTSLCVENLLGLLTCRLGDLLPGVVRTLTVQVTIDADLVARAGSPVALTNAVGVHSDLMDPNLTNNAATVTTIVNEAANVHVQTECEPDDPVPAGVEAVCTLLIENSGPSTARNVSAIATFLSDDNFRFGIVSVSGCIVPDNPQVDRSVVTCPLANLAAGSRIAVAIPVSASEPQNINSHVTAASDTPDPDTNNNQSDDTVTVLAVANVSLSQTATPVLVVAGNRLTFALMLTNHGPSTARDVVVTNLLPTETSFAKVGITGAAGLCTQQESALRTITCHVDSLRAGDAATITIEVVVDLAKLNPLIIRNIATVTAATTDPDTVNNNAVTDTTVKPPAVYISVDANGVVDGVRFNDEDILAYDPNTAAWTKVFDGSDVKVRANIDGFALLPDGSLLLTFSGEWKLPDLGWVDDSDIVKFAPTALGETTAGIFSWFLDGSDVGLTTAGEDIDAIAFAPDGRLVVSTLGNLNVGGVAGRDEDLFVLNATNLGEETVGFWELYFDGTDVGLNQDIWGAWIEQTGEVYLVTKGKFAVEGVSGGGNDIFVCMPSSLGVNTTCTFTPFWKGIDYGFRSGQIDGFAIGDLVPVVSSANLNDDESYDDSLESDGPVQDDVEDNEEDGGKDLSLKVFLPMVQQ